MGKLPEKWHVPCIPDGIIKYAMPPPLAANTARGMACAI